MNKEMNFKDVKKNCLIDFNINDKHGKAFLILIDRHISAVIEMKKIKQEHYHKAGNWFYGKCRI